MAKKMTLNETWKNCLSMWRWIANEVRSDSKRPVWLLKQKWVDKHGFDDKLDHNCFFCEYDEKHNRSKKACNSCPARKVEKGFHCNDDYSSYRFSDHPIAFYNKLVSLNRKRKKG